VFRYVEADDFGKPDNAFLVCTFWYIKRSPRSVGATRRVPCRERAACRNRHGLLAEHIDPGRASSGQLRADLQHVGLIGSAIGFQSGGIRPLASPLTPSPLRGEGDEWEVRNKAIAPTRGIGSLGRAEPPYPHRVRLRRRASSRPKVQRARHLREMRPREKHAWTPRGRGSSASSSGASTDRRFIVDFYCAELRSPEWMVRHACDAQAEYDAARAAVWSPEASSPPIRNDAVSEEALRMLCRPYHRSPSPQRGEGTGVRRTGTRPSSPYRDPAVSPVGSAFKSASATPLSIRTHPASGIRRPRHVAASPRHRTSRSSCRTRDRCAGSGRASGAGGVGRSARP